MADTPNLDLLVCDAMGEHVHLWATTTRLDSEAPVGHPLAPACRVCAGETVRLREQRRRSHVSAGRSRVYRLCAGCDRSGSEMTLPEGW